MKRTSGFTMSAVNAILCFFLQLSVMLFCKTVTGFCQIIVFVDQADIQSGRAWLAVIAVDTDTVGILRSKIPDHRIILFLLRYVEEAQNLLQVRSVSYSRQDG